MSDTPQKRQKTAKRDASGRIVPGSGALNPGGRPKIPEEFRTKCRKAAEESLPRLLAEVEEGGQHWVRAWELLAAYGFGKPTQPIAGEDGGPVRVAVDVEGIRKLLGAE